MNLLVVEDDARVADFLCRGLRAEGYQVSRAKNGAEGLTLARGAEIKLLLLDVMMPGMSGLEVCQQLRAQGNRVPILMLTAMDTLEDKVTGLRCGADDYLVKPFAFEELLARIEALLRRAHPVGDQMLERELRVADLVFDLDRMQVTRAGRLIALTAKELALLEFLIRSHGRLCSRERILSSLWGVAEDPLTNIVDVYIRRLRAKIDEGHAVALITTMRGLGYRLDDASS